MPQFLSPEWLAELAAAADAAPPLAGDLSEISMTIRYAVRGAPGGDVAYVIALDAGRVRVRPSEPSEAADLVLTTSYETAVALQRGDRTAQESLAADELKVGGRLEVLVRHGRALGALDDVFAPVRARTTYDRGADPHGRAAP